jgi:monofunctional biosynthetic peptidoglycan transglycosylase
MKPFPQWRVFILGLLLFSAFVVMVSVMKAQKLIPDLPRLKSNDYLQKKLNLPVWVSLDQISPLAVSAIVTSEDDDFYANRGFELDSIWDAFKTDLRTLQFKRGASTITQQVMKNTLLTRHKSISRKIEELILAREAERILTKDRILEIYLNTAQWGEKLYGIEEASRYYFNKSSKDLTLKEGSYLAMLLPSPIRYSRPFRDKKLDAHNLRIMDSILARMLAADKITPQQFETEEQASLPFEEIAPTPTVVPEVSPAVTATSPKPF